MTDIGLNTAYDNKDVITQIWRLKKGKQDKLTAGEGITIEDGVISATGGGGGTEDYNDLTNKPKVNSVTLSGNKTLSQLGIQPAGSYATTEQLGDVEEDLEEQIALKQNELTAGAGIAITDDVISCTVPGFSVQVVQVLPASGVTGTIYLVPVIAPGTQNIYNEFIWVNSQWEQIGTTQIDLSQYKVWSETKDYIDDEIDAVDLVLASKQDISGMPHIKWEEI